MVEPPRILFCFWGRRGALTQFALEVGRAVALRSDIDATLSVSRHNESFSEFESLGVELLPIDTFSTYAGAALGLPRALAQRRVLAQRAQRDRYHAAIELIPHVWSPVLMPALRRFGARYATIVHDANAHPGDWTARVKPILDMPIRSADRVLTLSDAVARGLLDQNRVAPDKLRVLFHPDFNYGVAPSRTRPGPGEPFRLLFLGRIMPYKGLPLFVEAVERLRVRGLPATAMVYGEGPLGDYGSRLEALGADVVNRWLTAAEIGAALSRAHAVVLSHVEASQSGVVAAAFGAGLPVVVTPVGGLAEQARNGGSVIAAKADASALADAVRRLMIEPELYQTCLDAVRLAAEGRSMARWLDAVVDAALRENCP